MKVALICLCLVACATAYGIGSNAVSRRNAFGINAVSRRNAFGINAVSRRNAFGINAVSKRNILDDIKNEANKLIACESTYQQLTCQECCESTAWIHESEKNLCNHACTILP